MRSARRAKNIASVRTEVFVEALLLGSAEGREAADGEKVAIADERLFEVGKGADAPFDDRRYLPAAHHTVCTPRDSEGWERLRVVCGEDYAAAAAAIVLVHNDVASSVL